MSPPTGRIQVLNAAIVAIVIVVMLVVWVLVR
jgi:hypothetical protein